ncbi:MAG TPA: acyl-CoA dehydrogenase family protein, partial [Brevibacterium sp.]|nr:acyl-CoA dehydrogenase family protein [Brevibacterium sp.]
MSSSDSTDTADAGRAARAAIDAAVSAAAADAGGLTDDPAVWGVLYDHGLAWVDFPRGSGGLGVSASLRSYAHAAVAAAGLSQPDPRRNTIGFGMAAPTIAVHGTDEQRRLLRDIFTLERIVCQLFSEPGAGSDLAAVATRAVRSGDDWRVTGQKVWTSGAQNADLAILVARTDPDVPKHRGLTYFLIDMKQSGIETRGLRQITGESEFNEVFLDEAVVPDSRRLGDVGEGWRVANTTLNSERVSIGSGAPREGGMIGVVASAWRSSTKYRSPVLRDELIRHWVDAEVQRTSGTLLNQKLAAGRPGPEGSGAKVSFARTAQALADLDLRMRGVDGLRYDSWE